MNRNHLTEAQRAEAEATIRRNLSARPFRNVLNDRITIRGKSPWTPSIGATSRVPDPAPVPEACTCCGSRAVECVHHDRVYGRSYGEWPWMLRCLNCAATVGLHPFTNIPLGTLATKAIRDARMAAKDVFQPIWESGEMSRSQAYAWLAQCMGLEPKECHIGMFDQQQCERVVELCEARSAPF